MEEYPHQFGGVGVVEESSERLLFEELLADLSARFVNIPPEQVDGEIIESQRRICEFLGIHRSSLWRRSLANPGEMVMTHYYGVELLEPLPERMEAYRPFPWILGRIREGKPFAVRDVERLPLEASVDRATIRRYGIRAILVLPLIGDGGVVAGALAFTQLHEPRDWPGSMVTRCQLISQVFAGALSRKRMEEKLRAVEASQRALIDAVDAALFLMNPDGSFKLVNRGMAERFKKTVEEMTHLGTYDLMSREIADVRMGYVRRVLETGQPYIARDMRDGRHYEHRLFPVKDSEGKVTHIATMGRDITVEKQAEEYLLKYELLAKGTHDIMLFARKEDGRIIEGNEAAVSAYGYSLEELKGLTIDRIHQEGEEIPLSRVLVCEREGISFETMHTRKDGSKFPVDVSVRGMDIGGTRVMVGIVRDISERKRAQEQLCEQHGRLAHLSRVASLGEMSSGLAHELNQPLTVILNYAEICSDAIERGNPDLEQVRQGMVELSHEAHRAAEIIRRWRAFIKKSAPQRKPLYIAQVIREGMDLMGFEIRRAGIRPQLKMDENLPRVSADAVQIQQVLVNLAQNAIDAMSEVPAGERRLMVRVCSREPGWVSVEVEDGGKGVSEEDRQRVFESFFTTKAQGLGLGLAISRTIIESHGGRLDVRSNVGKGATFWFSLPAIEG